MRVAIMFDNFGPYHVARLTGASRAGLDVLGVEVRARSSVYEWEAPELPPSFSHAALELDRTSVDKASIVAAMERSVAPFAPEVIALPGWTSAASIFAAVWAVQRGIATVVMSETNEKDFRRLAPMELAKRTIVGLYGAGLTGGDAARSYLVDLGMPEEAVFLGYDVIDNVFFETRADAAKAAGAMPQMAKRRTLDHRWHGLYFLASARFIPKKNLLRLIVAYSRYRAGTDPDTAWPLVILGDGVLRRDMEALIASLGLEHSVHLPGFRQYSELPEFYASAGGFVHPSTTEQWGLVVNEAMASGLPVAVSARCGCAEMLVMPGENGFTFDPFDTDSIAAALSAIAGHPDREGLGRASRRRISQWGPERFGEGMALAVETAQRRGAVVPGLVRSAAMKAAAMIQSRRG